MAFLASVWTGFEFVLQHGQAASAMVAAVALIWGVGQGLYGYWKQNRLARFEKYSALSKDWSEDKNVQKIKQLLEDDPEEELLEIPYTEKEEFVAVFEEIALMLESGIIRIKIAYYMFGYYTLLCEKNQNFWQDMDRDSHYWTLFFRFAEKMKAIERKVLAHPETIKKWSFRY
jgi:hypothetical protein